MAQYVHKTYVIDGKNFTTLEEFYEEISNNLIPGAGWGKNLDAFHDILRGGFGTPDEGFVLRWKNAALSRERLGYPETIRQLRKRLQHCHPTNRPAVQAELEMAQRGQGNTVFDWLTDIIGLHSDIELVLE